ncbi:MAG TPA: M14 family zinc carboxypeptidase [Microlunatus sp.]|nr:M14 family zinc carboxypeptidase [Microlunatus sp.]
MKTPFETSNGAAWTTQPQAVRFLRDLDAASERVRVQTVGRTLQNRPIQLVAVGAPAPATQAAAAAGSVVLFTCSVHGDENSGREACLQMARDLAFTTDAALSRFLERTTVLFVNPNPNGWVADTRGNAEGVDVNRDYMALATPEARAIVKIIRDWRPDVLNDLHEFGPGEFYDTDLLHLWPRNRNVDPVMHDLAREMSEEYSSAQVTSLGYSSGVYGQLVKDGEPFRQVAGDGQARILRNYAGLVNVAGMLSETANEALDDAEEADASLLNRRRVEVNYASAAGSVQMVIENRDLLARETAAAAARHTELGRTGDGVIYFAGQDDMIPTAANQVEPEPMCGYQLTAATFTQVRATLALHGVTSRADAGGRYVTLAQPTRGLIPLLFDSRSQYKIADGTPVAC